MKKYSLAIILLMSTLKSDGQWAGAILDSLTNNSSSDQVNRNCIDIHENTIHVVFKRNNGSSNDLYYKFRDSTNTWSIEVPFTNNPTPIPSSNPAIAAGLNADIAYIVYQFTDPTDGDEEINLATRNGVGWLNTQITGDTTEDLNPTISIDVNGFLHIAWIGIDPSGDYKICYATNLSGNFVSQTLALSDPGPFGGGAAPQIAVESTGIAHIAFRGGTFGSYRIHHAYNTTPGDSNWTIDIITSTNAEDLIAAIDVTNDSLVHLAVNGNDGFGFPWSAYYMTKNGASGAYSNHTQIAPGMSGNLGDMFVDHNSVPHFVLNEVSGNFYTGNIIYADSNNWAGTLLLQTTDIFECNLVLDEQLNGYLLGHQGINSNDEEIILYGPQTGVGVDDMLSDDQIFTVTTSGNNINVAFENNFTGMISCYNVEGKLIAEKRSSFGKNTIITYSNLARGIYVITCGGRNTKVMVN